MLNLKISKNFLKNFNTEQEMNIKILCIKQLFKQQRMVERENFKAVKKNKDFYKLVEYTSAIKKQNSFLKI